MEHFMRLISRIHSCGVQYRTAKLQQSGLMGYQVGYFLQVCNHPGITQDTIGKNLHINKSNVARQLAALQEAGLITRTQSPQDKRALQVFPTEKGLQLLPQVRQVLHQYSSFLTQDFTPEQTGQLINLLGLLADKAEQFDLAREELL